MQYALVDSNNVVKNFIVPPVGEWVPPVGLTVQQVNDWVEVGQDTGTPQPSPTTQTSSQKAEVAIAAGVMLSSASVPELDGAYSVDAAAQAQINAVVTYIMVNNSFPAGASSLPWPDAGRTLHFFTSIALFKAFATAVADFVATINIYENSNGMFGSIPSNALSIP